MNLIPFDRRRARRRAAHLRRWCAGCGVYGLALLGLWAATPWWWASPRHAVGAQMAAAQRRTQAARTATHQLAPRLTDARRALHAGRMLGRQPDWSLLLGILSAPLGRDAMLTDCRLRPTSRGGPARAGLSAPTEPSSPDVSNHVLELKGVAKSSAAVLSYVRQLEATELFDAVKLTRTQKKRVQNVAAVGFAIRCTLVSVNEAPAAEDGKERSPSRGEVAPSEVTSTGAGAAGSSSGGGGS